MSMASMASCNHHPSPAPYLRVRDGADRCVVNVSSTLGVHGNAGQANYAAAKAAVVGLTKTLAKEWGPAFGVRANTVAFGHIATRLTDAKEKGVFVEGPGGVRHLGRRQPAL
ncbi:hypothetical protein LY76DRAFT_658028 [Colletotrichum caudatum]|nr:hypothetical protein LY76DRAFT_658028 [Colletotrichum caudatum]